MGPQSPANNAPHRPTRHQHPANRPGSRAKRLTELRLQAENGRELDKVLVALDELGGTARDDHKLKVPGYSRDQLLQYLDTLYEEGMVKATQRISTFEGLSFLGISITTKGLDRIRKLTGPRRQADGGEEEMRVFLSWSGDASHALAEALHGWLPTALPFVDPWMSSKDLAKGKRQDEELAKKLDRTGHSIACVTPGVQGSPWVNFEAGAISKLVGESHVYPLLLGVSAEDLRDLPLGRFQCTDAKKQEDVFRLLRSINAQHASPIPNEKLRRDMSNPSFRLSSERYDRPRCPGKLRHSPGLEWRVVGSNRDCKCARLSGRDAREQRGVWMTDDESRPY